MGGGVETRKMRNGTLVFSLELEKTFMSPRISAQIHPPPSQVTLEGGGFPSNLRYSCSKIFSAHVTATKMHLKFCGVCPSVTISTLRAQLIQNGERESQ